ncbi:CGLD27 family protein [Candidatus Synechococcus calcipolaris G9]|uniref:CGLD27 family protein n=1 Tax=Candidatus Synechococcus calcipolaris G9 TaxID=1497997 RepID=A0ABT6EVX2_9SYNE|nr:CGLD27 family protein [Candidatus Synechococcus calcipolaris]MDG2989939.1 CGLD27 family protein [Candidatus Synechococcus calcipolaris G9]
MLCPVPAEQRPLNEYRVLKDSWFFGWSTGSAKVYTRRLILLWSLAWLVSGPVAAGSFDPQEYPMNFALGGILGSNLAVGLVLLRLVLGWGYVGDRLQRPTVIYEETGWYDGQEWIKPAAELDQDRLIVQYELRPILYRLRLTLGGVIASSMLIIALWLAQ